jgi:hypothetical protein
MRRVVKVLLAVIIVVFASLQFVRPARTNPPADPADALTTYVPAHVAEILDRSCRDCHSNETHWPWYSHIAPASWFVIDHVDHGRSHFNYSTWPAYGAEQKLAIRRNSCQMARAGTMPLPSYVLLHGAARLSAGDIEALCAWAVPSGAH